jgi:hypothetical protein
MMPERRRTFAMGAETGAPGKGPGVLAFGLSVIFVGLLAASCGGRSAGNGSPDAAAPDGSGLVSDAGGGADAGCNAKTCPSGCCNTAGTCLPGTDVAACGALGQACSNCQAAGHNLCDPTLHACGDNVGPMCDAANCMGCCEGSQCLVGTTLNACGQMGAACTDCATTGQSCVASPGSAGGSCQTAATPPMCNAQTCASGCCDTANTCHRGTGNVHCGAGGGACQDCTTTNDVCTNQICVAPPPPCPNGCTTCCDTAGTCLPGNADTQCGSSGTQCVDCTTSMQVCSGGSCSPAMACPAPYMGCMTGNVTLLTPTMACAPSDLQMAATACATGFSSSATCQNFFSQLNMTNMNCANCLGNFAFDFNQPDGIFACAMPYVALTCAQQAFCYQDCMDNACMNCGSTTLPACLMTSGPSACSMYAPGNTCITAALSGPASVCNPATYSGNFGNWLAAVGAAYCTVAAPTDAGGPG